MGFAVMMFGTLLVLSVLTALVITYGETKDSRITPLKAENVYAERETGKAQTAITIVNTCLRETQRYTKGSGSEPISGPHILQLTVKNNGSSILNSTRTTLLYNNTYAKFIATTGNVWAPLTNAILQYSNVYIPTPDAPAPGLQLRLLVAVENGITVIAPTSPNNFTGRSVKDNTSFDFTWNASADDTGVAYYILHSISSSPNGECPPNIVNTSIIPGSSTSSALQKEYACPGGSCSALYFFLTAVDLDGNMGIPSRTLKCSPSSDKECSF